MQVGVSLSTSRSLIQPHQADEVYDSSSIWMYTFNAWIQTTQKHRWSISQLQKDGDMCKSQLIGLSHQCLLAGNLQIVAMMPEYTTAMLATWQAVRHTLSSQWNINIWNLLVSLLFGSCLQLSAACYFSGKSEITSVCIARMEKQAFCVASPALCDNVLAVLTVLHFGHIACVVTPLPLGPAWLRMLQWKQPISAVWL